MKKLIDQQQSVNQIPYKVNRKYKDNLFRLIFQDKTDLLALYNALNRSDYQDEDALISYTIEDAIYISLKNDSSCIEENILRELLVKQRGEVREMVLSTFDQENHERILKEAYFEQGLHEGEKSGSKRILKLIAEMSAAGEADLIPKLSEDEEFLSRMYEKYCV